MSATMVAFGGVMSEMTKLTLRLPATLHRRLSERARTTRQSLNRVIVEALLRGLGHPAPRDAGEDPAYVAQVLREGGMLADLSGLHVMADAEPPATTESLEALRAQIGLVKPLASAIVIADRGRR
jgi:hypothetical protein